MSTTIKKAPYNLDPAFERAVVALACLNQRFYGRICSELDPELFKSDVAKLAMRASRAIFRDVGHGPGSGMIVVQRLRRWVADGKVKFEEVKKVAEMLDDAEDAGLPDPEAVIAELSPIIALRLRDEAVQESIASFGKGGDLTKVVKLEERAARVGQADTSIGTFLGAASWEEVQSLRHLERLTTGIVELDAVLDGGLQRGGLGMWLAESGGGKSLSLSHTAAACLANGLFVGYISYELPPPLVLARIKANLTGIPTNALMAGQTAEAQRILNAMAPKLGRLVVHELTPYATTVEDLFAWVENAEEFAQREMDLLVIDYADKIGVKKMREDDTSGYNSSRVVYESIRIYAHERKKFAWTASQATRRKDRKRRLDMNDTADSMHKVRIVDLCVTINPVGEEGGDESPEHEFFVAKHRTGRSRISVGPLPSAWEVGQMVMR